MVNRVLLRQGIVKAVFVELAEKERDHLFSARDEGAIWWDVSRFTSCPFRAWVSAFPPESNSVGGCVNAPILPPLFLVANTVQRPMMGGAERHHPLVADLAPQGPGLGKAQVMGMAG